MPTYCLKCVLRFKTGHAGAAFDEVSLGADGPEEAVALAELYRCTTPGMNLSVAVLTDETGSAIWTRRGSSVDDEMFRRSQLAILT